MANKYTEEEWDSLGREIFKRFPLHENLDLSLQVLDCYSEEQFINDKKLDKHRDEKVRVIIKELRKYTFCDLNKVALGINSLYAKGIVVWRLKHGK